MMEQVRRFFTSLILLLLLLIALLAPFGFLVGILTGVLFFAWIIEWNWKEKMRLMRETGWLLWPWLLFYGLQLLGLLWTANMHEGAFTAQVKLSLLVFPLVISSRRFDAQWTQRLLATFLLGLAGSGIFMLCRSAWIYFHEGINTFYYQDFSKDIAHPSYLSMYFCAGIMLLFHGVLLQSFPMRQKVIAILGCLFFAVIIFLLSSKLGILSMLLLFFGYIVYAIFRFKRYVVGLAALVTLVAGCFIALKAFPQVAARLDRMKQVLLMTEEVDPSQVESNQARLLVWQADYAVASRHPWSGVGTGDTEDSLKAEYFRRGMTGAYDEGLNAHSQLFQSAVTLGLPGLLALLLLIFVPAAWAMRRQFGFAVLFALLFFLNIVPESMFERQDGTLFFGFFYSLILFAIDRRCLTPLKAPPISFV